jgi:mitogen-activated protein kinase kinase 1
VKITDFGTANVSSSLVGQFGTFIGTVSFMSPERLKGETHDYSSDIWSVGMIILKVLKCFIFQNGLTIGFWKLVKILSDQKIIDQEIEKIQCSFELKSFLIKWF